MLGAVLLNLGYRQIHVTPGGWGPSQEVTLLAQRISEMRSTVLKVGGHKRGGGNICKLEHQQ